MHKFFIIFFLLLSACYSLDIEEVDYSSYLKAQNFCEQAEYYYQTNNLAKAEALYLIALEYYSDPLAFLGLSGIYYKRENYQMAEYFSKLAIRQSPDNLMSWNSYAASLFQLGEYLKADQIVTQILTEDPANLSALKLKNNLVKYLPIQATNSANVRIHSTKLKVLSHNK